MKSFIHDNINNFTLKNFCRASDLFQNWWAEVTHGAKYGRSFFEMMSPSISN